MQSKRKLANEQTTEGVYERYFLGLWLFDKQPEKQLEREIDCSKPCLSVLKNSVNSTRNSYKVLFFSNLRAFTKSSCISKVNELYTKSLSQRQIPNSQGPFGGVIFLAIFSDINAVDAKAMRKASNELYFLPLILAKCMEGKKNGLFTIKHFHSNRSFLHMKEVWMLKALRSTYFDNWSRLHKLRVKQHSKNPQN